MKAISIKQPWASLIVQGLKNIENRAWKCPEKYIGKRVLIHASEKPVKEGWDALTEEQHNELPVEIPIKKLPTSKIIGSVKIVDCVINHPSIWAEKSAAYGFDKDVYPGGCPSSFGREGDIYNWVLSDPILYENPIENIKGKLSFWNYDKIEEVTIECPECGFVQPAVVDFSTVLFNPYIHDCKNCGHLIEEPEWNEVKEENI